MIVAVASSSTTKAFWYLTRATGLVSLVLLTLVMVLGIVQVERWSPGRWPRFVIADLHRNASLLAVVFLGVHILTSVVDGYAPIGWAAVVVPFTSSYRPIWLGSRRRRPRPHDRVDDHQPAPPADRAHRVADHPLGRLCLLADRVRARSRHRQRRTRRMGASGSTWPALGRDARGGDLAARRRLEPGARPTAGRRARQRAGHGRDPRVGGDRSDPAQVGPARRGRRRRCSARPGPWRRPPPRRGSGLGGLAGLRSLRIAVHRHPRRPAHPDGRRQPHRRSSSTPPSVAARPGRCASSSRARRSTTAASSSVVASSSSARRVRLVSIPGRSPLWTGTSIVARVADARRRRGHGAARAADRSGRPHPSGGRSMSAERALAGDRRSDQLRVAPEGIGPHEPARLLPAVSVGAYDDHLARYGPLPSASRSPGRRGRCVRAAGTGRSRLPDGHEAASRGVRAPGADRRGQRHRGRAGERQGQGAAASRSSSRPRRHRATLPPPSARARRSSASTAAGRGDRLGHEGPGRATRPAAADTDRDRPRPLRRGRGVGSGELAQRRRGQAHVRAPAPVRAGGSGTADDDEQRRDLRPHRPDRPLRTRLVPVARLGGLAGDDAHHDRGAVAVTLRVRDPGRHVALRAARRRRRPRRRRPRPCWWAATSGRG